MEAAAEGITLAWAPMLDVARDARWGRCAESPGEDPLLCAAFGTAMIEGYQGDDLAGADAVMATAKHFAGYGLSESGRDYNAVDASPYRMHNVVLPPFKAAVDAGVGAVMVGFHRSEEHTSDIPYLMRISYDVFCWKTKHVIN